MALPERIDARWIATLGDEQLIVAEARLHKEFRKQELAEKQRAGARYVMLRGPESLVDAWLRWLLVNNETFARGLVVNRTGGSRKASLGS